jgi:hypothetical protein
VDGARFGGKGSLDVWASPIADRRSRTEGGVDHEEEEERGGGRGLVGGGRRAAVWSAGN